MKKRTICIDFDGVLHDYSKGYQGKDVFGTMIPNADNATQLLHKNGWTIIIYTTREKSEKLENWLKDHKIVYDYINENPKQPDDAKEGKLIADIYLDDRGVCFQGNWDEWLMNQIAGFQPWQVQEKNDLERGYKQGKSRLERIREEANCGPV